MAEVARDNPELDKVLYDGPMMEFNRGFLGGEVRHFDYTWFRTKSPGDNGTQPHYDVVYMGRGTRKLFTSWTPLSDITMDMGGLIVLEGSHRQHELIDTYGQLDVDRYCENDATTRELIETARALGLTSLAQSAVRPSGNPPPSALTPTIRRRPAASWVAAG